MYNFVSAVVTLSLLALGDCQFSHSVPRQKEYMPGEEFEITCSGALEANEEVVFLKLQSFFDTLGGEVTFGDDENPLVLITFDNTDAGLEANAPGRYVGQGSSNDTYFEYTYKIQDLHLEDTGNFSCAVKAADGSYPNMVKIPMRVLGNIQEIGIVYKQQGVERADIGSVTVDDGSFLTYQIEDPAGELVCVLQTSTTPPKTWSMMLDDTDVTDKFEDFTENDDSVSSDNGGLYTVLISNYFFATSPATSGSEPRFTYKDSGKTLTFKASVEGYDEMTVTKELDIQFVPVQSETVCPVTYQGPEGRDDFKILCYTWDPNPAASVTWEVSGAALRDGITAQTSVKGSYLVSVLTFDELRSGDFTSYTFTVTNNLGSATANAEIIEDSDVIEGDIDGHTLPWNAPAGDGASTLAANVIGTLFIIFLGYLQW